MDTIKQIIDKFSLVSKKSPSQNFILDENITDKIVRKSNIKNQLVLEIGPGPGCLTRSLIKAGVKRIIAVEKDKRCINILMKSNIIPKKNIYLAVGDKELIEVSKTYLDKELNIEKKHYIYLCQCLGL